MKLRMLLVIVMSFLAQACVLGPQRTILKQEERQNIQKVDLYDLVIQDELRPSVELSNASAAGAGFGALGALITASIDSSVNKSRSQIAEELTDPLLEAAIDVDARKIVEKEINRSLESQFPLDEKRDSARAVVLSASDLKARITKLAEGEYLLYVSSFYGLVQNSSALKVNAVAIMYKRPKLAKGSKDFTPSPVYLNNFFYRSTPVGKGGSDSIAAWSKDNAALYSEKLEEGIKEIVASLKYDLQNQVKFECGRAASIDIFGLNGETLKSDAVIIEQRNERAMARVKASGALYSVPGIPEQARTLKSGKCK